MSPISSMKGIGMNRISMERSSYKFHKGIDEITRLRNNTKWMGSTRTKILIREL